MKVLILTVVATLLIAACSAPSGIRRDPILDCPISMVLICETSRDQEPGNASDEEIPQYDRCFCEHMM